MESEPCGCRPRQSACSPGTSGGETSLSSEQFLCDDGDDDDEEPRREATTTTCCAASCADGGCPCRLGGSARLELASNERERAKSSSRSLLRCGASEKVQCFCSLSSSSSSLTGDARCQCCKRKRQAARAIISASHAIQCLCGHQCHHRHHWPNCHCTAQLVCVRASRCWLMSSSARMREHDYANKREQSQQQQQQRQKRRKQRSCQHQSVKSTAAAAGENLALKRDAAARDAKATGATRTTTKTPVDKVESEGHQHAERTEHESNKLCDATSNKLAQSKRATTSGHRNQGESGHDGAYTIRGGENARCKCAGLIELFEQQVRVCDNDDAQQDVTGSKQKKHHNNCDSRKLQASKSKQTKSGGRRVDDMRDIITPVKYEPSEESATTSASCDDSLEPSAPTPPDDWAVAGATGGGDRLDDSLEWDGSPKRSTSAVGGGGCCCAHHKLSMKHASPVERIRSCGAVRVLPRTTDPSASVQSRRTTPEKLRKRLTKTHWQPPTDARKYEYSRPSSQDSNHRHHHHQQLGRLSTSSPGGNDTLPGPRGAPQVVRHQASSSRRLLKQLAKLRQQQVGVEDSEAQSVRIRRSRRPESVARIEELIEHLERATREWDEDEHLLDRAERRDFVSQLESRTGNMAATRTQRELTTGGHIQQEQEDLLNFGCRQDIPSLEVQSIEESHERRAASRGSHAVPADRQADDLAVRRLRSLATGSGRSPMGVTSGSQRRQTSYLLCANATGSPAPIDSRPNRKCTLPDVERRLREDDLHYRRVTQSHAAPVSPELPFGIPRNQSTQTLARLSASERLAADTPTSNTAHFLGKPSCDRSDGERSKQHNQQRSQPKSPCTFTSKQQTQTTCTTQTTTTTTETRRTTQTTRASETDEKLTMHTTGQEDMLRRDKSVQTTSTEPAPELEPSAEVRTTKRSDSRVSFVGDNLKDDNDEDDNWRRRRAGGGCSSADSGLGQGCSPAPTPQSGTGPSLEYIDGASDPDDLELEIDLVARAPSCESPAPLERHQAELTMTPVRRRPRINIDRPRAKSPLLRVGSIRRKSHATSRVQMREPPARQTVVIQTYSDSMKRRLKTSQQQQQQGRRRSVTEVECQYEFSDDDEEDSDEMRAQQRARLLVTTYESPESSPHDDNDDDEDEQAAASLRLLDRAIESHAKISPRPVQVGGAPPLGIRPRSRGETSPGPRFSLGQYRTLGRRQNLIIL